MSDMSDEHTGGSERGETIPYEAPKLTHVGNARELLAGASGSVMDALPSVGMPSQSSG